MIVDARGHRCPVPSLRLRAAIQGARPGVRITLLATDPMARVDVPFLMAEMGGRVVSITEDGRDLAIVIESPGAPTG